MYHISDGYETFEDAMAAAEKIIAEERKSSIEKQRTFVEGNWIESTRKMTDDRGEEHRQITIWNIEKNYDGKFYFYAE